MKVAVIGAGNVGQALAGALARAGHEVSFGVRTPAQPGERTVGEAATWCDVAILAVPFQAAADVIAAAHGFAGKVLVDATNPLGMGPGGLALTVGFADSGAERIAALAPRAHVFKTFNQTGFENMAAAGRYPSRPVMFVAGDAAAAKPTVLRLVSDAGFEALDAGGLSAARLLEPLAMMWIELARKRGLGQDFTFAIQRPKP